MILLKNKITLCASLLVAGCFLSLNISCTEKIAGSEVTNEDAVCLVGRVLDQRGQGVSNIIARLDKIQLSDTTDNNGNYSLKLSKQEISDLRINLDTLNDTVKIISSGNVASSISITKWIDTLPSVYLIQRNIYGKLETDGSVLKRIEAIIAVLDTNNNVIEEFSKELWFNTGTSGFSGFSYFPKNTGSQKYSVYVRVFNKDSIFSGKSQIIYFNDLAGDIEIPSFNSNFYSALQIFAGNDTTLTINVTFHLSASLAKYSPSIIKKWEWDINGNGFKQTANGDTAIVLPDSETTILCIIKSTDTLGNTALDTLIVTCLQDIPSISGFEIPAIPFNTKITIKANAINIGSLKWEWNIDNISYEQSDSINFSCISFTSPSIPSVINCSLRVTDDDGNTGYKTCTIPIGSWKSYCGLDYISGNVSPSTTIAVPVALNENVLYSVWGQFLGNDLEIQLKTFNGSSWENSGTPSLIPVKIDYQGPKLTCEVSNTGEIYSVLLMNDSLYTFKYSSNTFANIGKFTNVFSQSAQIRTCVSQDGTFYIATTQGTAEEKYITLYQYKNAIWTLIPTDNLEKGDISTISIETIDNDVYLGGIIPNSKCFLYKYSENNITTINVGQYQVLD